MDKDVKKIISEAFNELYHEMVSEAPEGPSLKAKEKIQADDMLNRIRKYGAVEGFVDYGPRALPQNVFNYIVDTLVDEYKSTGSQKIKGALQGAFYPAPNSKMLQILMQKWNSYGAEKVQNAAAESFTDRFMNNFDQIN